MEIVRVYIGYDTREPAAFHALAQSLIQQSSLPVSVTPLCLKSLNTVLQRPRDPRQSTDFAYSRFLVPFLSQFEGWSIFVDCDFVFTTDIVQLWQLRDDKYAVMCCQHDYRPKTRAKFLGHVQEAYPKKNWSSLMLLNNRRCTALTPEYVSHASGAELHRFTWLTSEGLIGALPIDWNFLVGEYLATSQIPKGLHYTIGGPYFQEYSTCDFSDLWFSYFDAAAVPLTPNADRLQYGIRAKQGK